MPPLKISPLPYPLGWLLPIRCTNRSNMDEDVLKLDPARRASGNVKQHRSGRKQYRGSSKTLQSHHALQQSPIWVHTPRTESRDSRRYRNARVHTSILHSRQKMEATTCPRADEWIYKVLFIPITEYDSALKRKEILT